MDYILIIFLPLLFWMETTVKAEGIEGDATCDNMMSFYADGDLISELHGWTQTAHVTFPSTTTVIGIKCVDYGSVGGIKAAFNNGIQTDESWKCLNKFQQGWAEPGFDDSSWQSATLPSNPDSIWGQRPTALIGRGYWIWTSGWKGQDTLVYCRKVLRSSPPPQPIPPTPHFCAPQPVIVQTADTSSVVVKEEVGRLSEWMEGKINILMRQNELLIHLTSGLATKEKLQELSDLVNNLCPQPGMVFPTPPLGSEMTVPPNKHKTPPSSAGKLK